MRAAGWLYSSAVFLVMLSAAAPTQAATPEQVDHALLKAKSLLYSKMNDGNWEVAQTRETGKTFAPASVASGQWGGMTAIATYALLAAGEDPQHPKLSQAIKWLKTADIYGVYALSMRCQVWLLLPHTPETRSLIDADRKRISEAFNPNGRGKFLYTYLINKRDINQVDHSVSQYGVLAMWACAQMGIEIPTNYWQDVDARWKYDQQADGGWLYADKPNTTDHAGSQGSMTAAGVASLFITQDYVNPAAGIRCTGNISNDHIDRGLKWMADHVPDWTNDHNWGGFDLPGYTLYGVERIGVASGLKYIGTVDWYQYGAEWCVKNQHEDGNWNGGGNIPNIAYCMLFLVRGRAPVLINKVQYTNAEGPDVGKDGHWDQRPRDVANFVHWMTRQTERDINWQVTNLSVPEDELHDAPFLYISGNQALSLKPEEIEKLKQFVQHGGMILFNADCGASSSSGAQNPFVASIIKLGKTMFPDTEFRDLPPTHPIFTNEQYPPSRWKQKVVLKGLSNGVRELMIIMPNDPAKAWQLQETTGEGRSEAYQATDDLILYGTDKQNLLVKGQSFLIKPSSKVEAKRTAKIGRLKYAGNWDPEPGGWERLSALMHNGAALDLTVKPVDLGKNLLSGYKLLHLTGTTSFSFTAAQKQQLMKYVNDGGTVLIDCAGGSSDFATSAEKLLKEMFPDGLKDPLPPDDPIFKTGVIKADIHYRAFAHTLLGSIRAPQLKAIQVAGRNAVFYSREDLSAGLVGEPMDGIIGYAPDSSSEIVSAIILQAMGKQ